LKFPLREFFFSLDITPTESWTFFSQLDADRSREVELEELIIGCLRLKGGARSVDVVRLAYENKWVSKTISYQ